MNSPLATTGTTTAGTPATSAGLGDRFSNHAHHIVGNLAVGLPVPTGLTAAMAAFGHMPLETLLTGLGFSMLSSIATGAIQAHSHINPETGLPRHYDVKKKTISFSPWPSLIGSCLMVAASAGAERCFATLLANKNTVTGHNTTVLAPQPSADCMHDATSVYHLAGLPLSQKPLSSKP